MPPLGPSPAAATGSPSEQTRAGCAAYMRGVEDASKDVLDLLTSVVTGAHYDQHFFISSLHKRIARMGPDGEIGERAARIFQQVQEYIFAQPGLRSVVESGEADPGPSNKELPRGAGSDDSALLDCAATGGTSIQKKVQFTGIEAQRDASDCTPGAGPDTEREGCSERDELRSVGRGADPLPVRPAGPAPRSSSSSKQRLGERTHWERDSSSSKCRRCIAKFTFFNRRHHCRDCGLLVCSACSTQRVALPGHDKPQRVCAVCYAQRLSPAAESQAAQGNVFSRLFGRRTGVSATAPLGGQSAGNVQSTNGARGPAPHFDLSGSGREREPQRAADRGDGGGDAEDGSADEDAEDPAEYCEGGYHRVRVGDRYSRHYVVHSKLGTGGFSTVWLAKDERGGPRVALKIGKAADEHKQAFVNEISILRAIQSTRQKLRASRSSDSQALCEYGRHCIALFDTFDVVGPNGTHPTAVMEAAGVNLLQLITRHGAAPIAPAIVKTLTCQMLRGLVFIHEAVGVAHCDMKPENILLATVDHCMTRKAITPGKSVNQGCSEDLLTGRYGRPLEGESYADSIARQYMCKIADFGGAHWLDRDGFTPHACTLEYRPPEMLLGYFLEGSADVFSTACVTYELLTGEYLFNPKSQSKIEMSTYHLMLYQQLLGPIPATLAKADGDYCPEDFDEQGEFQFPVPRQTPLLEVFTNSHRMRERDAREVTDFLLPMLDPHPAKRITARQALEHRWLRVDEEDARFPLAGAAASTVGREGAAPSQAESRRSSDGDGAEDRILPLQSAAGMSETANMGSEQSTDIQALRAEVRLLKEANDLLSALQRPVTVSVSVGTDHTSESIAEPFDPLFTISTADGTTPLGAVRTEAKSLGRTGADPGSCPSPAQGPRSGGSTPRPASPPLGGGNLLRHRRPPPVTPRVMFGGPSSSRGSMEALDTLPKELQQHADQATPLSNSKPGCDAQKLPPPQQGDRYQ